MITITGEFYSSKNSQTIVQRANGGRFIMKNKNADREQKEFQWQLKQDAVIKEWERMKAGKEYPLKVQFKLYRRTRRAFDFVNAVQNFCDAMTKEGYWPDDDCYHMIPVFVPHEVDPDNPRCEVEIL